MRRWLSLGLIFCALSVSAADDYKVIKLEQDMRNLEREVRTLARQVEDLRTHLARQGERPPSSQGRAHTPARSNTWLSLENWNRVALGMSELEVIERLGPPTSMRSDGDERVLLYAMEIGATNFLSGSITLRDRVVAAVEKPALK